MLYAVAFPEMGDQALDALNALGYDVAFMRDPPADSCQDVFPAEAGLY